MAYPSTQVQRRFVTKCRRGGGVQPGLLSGRRSDSQGPTTCRAALVTDNPGLPRAPPGAQTGAVHRQRILLSCPRPFARAGLVNTGEARACTVDAL